MKRIPLKTPRAMLRFVPDWGALEKVAWQIAWRNAWRVQPDYQVDDLVQEGLIIFHRLVDRYWPDVQNPAHFAALFRTSLNNKINNLAKGRSRRLSHVDGSVDLLNTHVVSSDVSVLEVQDLLEQLNAEDPLYRLVKQLVEGELRPRPQRKGRGRRLRARETTNEFLCRVAGVEGVDLATRVRQWISGELNSCTESVST